MRSTALAVAVTMTMAGAASANFLDDFESYADGTNLFGTGGWSDAGGAPLHAIAGTGVGGSQGVGLPGSPATWGRAAHAGNLGGSTTANVSALLNAGSGWGSIRLSENPVDQSGWEFDVIFFGNGMGGNSQSVETQAFSDGRNYEGGEQPKNIDFPSMGWFEGQIDYRGGTSVTASWRDVDDTTGLPLGNGDWTLIGDYGGLVVSAGLVLDAGGINVHTAGTADVFRIGTDYVPVPEPASLGLLALTGLAMLRRRR